jgi:anti-sigma B factor antagonist
VELTIADAGAADPDRVLTLSGSLDLESRDQLVSVASPALAAPHCDRLILDLADVEFIDSTGLGALIAIRGVADDLDKELELRNPHPRVERILAVSGVEDSFAITHEPASQ